MIHRAFDLFLHVFIGYTVARLLLNTRGWAGALGGLFPNLDYPLQHWTPVPVTHDGIFHTPAFLAVLLVLAVLAVGRRSLLFAGFAIGFLLELAVDTVQGGAGIMWLVPLTTARFAAPIPFSELYWGTLLYAACAVVLVEPRLAGYHGLARRH